MDNLSLLKQEAYKGLKKLGLDQKQEYLDRLAFELKTVEELGFVPYFLVMWDICRFAREKNILYSPGRGSGCGSLLNYSLYITLVDPIKYGLYFERFLNPSRISPPDIDYDTSNRDQIILYLHERYGKDRVARVGSLNFLRTKSAIRDIGRVLGKDFDLVEELTNLVPPPVAGLWDSFQDECLVEPKLLDPKYKDIIGPVEKLWGIVRSYGTHAGGVAIAPGPINRFVPLYKDKDGNAVSQFDWRDLEESGLLKFDILGLKTLEIIERCLSYIKLQGTNLILEKLEDGDTAAYDLICSGDLDGIFQLGGSESIKQLTIKMAPRDIRDLSLVTSLFRPGPISSGLLSDAVAIKNGEKEAVYLHPTLELILKETHSVFCYQEQVMKICTDLCGYTAPEADNMRKILGKKLKEKMKEEEPKFISGAIQNGLAEKDAKTLFTQLQDYAQYLFNKCLIGETRILVQKDNAEISNLSIDELSQINNLEDVKILSFNPETKEIESDQCLEVIKTNEQDVYEINLSDGSVITCTLNHTFLCSDMEKHPLWEILQLDLEIVSV